MATISRPDSTTEKFTNDQESGWTNSGTSASPAAATLLAQAGGTYTSPNSNVTTIQPDWLGLGMAGNQIDALGDVQMYDRTSNGLATVAVDQVNRITPYRYDSKGNITSEVYADGNPKSYTYNSDSEPLTFTNADGEYHDLTPIRRRQLDGHRGPDCELDDHDLHVDGETSDYDRRRMKIRRHTYTIARTA